MSTTHTSTTPTSPVEEAAIDDRASHPFVGRWNSLVSTTNWEKGRIISEWRESLRDANAPVSAWSDEAWSRLVGGVTGQHAGRLRRVFQRFGAVCTGYKGLYWSHFHVAVEWDDAEMWLEGAVQNGWSVALMQRERWSVLAPNESPPSADDAISGELDEDFEPARGAPPHASSDSESGGVQSAEASEWQAKDNSADGAADADDSEDSDDAASATKIAPIKPFENLAELPPDMHDAFEMLKLSILRHKLTEWSEIAVSDVLGALDGLKALAVAPN